MVNESETGFWQSPAIELETAFRALAAPQVAAGASGLAETVDLDMACGHFSAKFRTMPAAPRQGVSEPASAANGPRSV